MIRRRIYTKKGKCMVMMVVVMKQLCTCRLRAGVVPGEGQRLPLLCSVCTCNCSCGVLRLCSGCSCRHYGSIQPSTTAQHPLTSLHQQQPIIHIEQSSTTTAASHHDQSSRRHKDIHFPTTILLPAGRWLPVWRKLSPFSFG